MGEDPWETIFFAAYHLFGSIESLTPEKQQVLVSLLRRQKEWLECYTNNLRYFLISGISHAVVMPSAYMIEMQEEYDWVRFALPDAGTLLIIGCLSIPSCSKRVDLAHKVINYLLSKQGGVNCFEEHYFYPANKKAYSALPKWVQDNPYLFPQGEVFSRMGVAHNQLPLTSVEQMWYDIKR
jgi:spermidine/putrescine-binding protein